MDKQKLLKSIEIGEGLVLKMYKDTEGLDTIGIGHLVLPSERSSFVNGITKEQAYEILDRDLTASIAAAKRFPFYITLSDVRQRVLIEMEFNLGSSRLNQFKKMIFCLEKGDFEGASVQMLDSKWAKQVKGRAARLSEMMRTNEDPLILA